MDDIEQTQACAPAGILASEFAAVRIAIDESANGPRLLIVDLDTDASVYLEPLELSSFCLAQKEDRDAWLRVGSYRPGAMALGEAEH